MSNAASDIPCAGVNKSQRETIKTILDARCQSASFSDNFLATK
ncbi:hypothetical protein TERTU_1364 [Teredinibacter turnerae T7901]|uniref:Uncharacterized protein n=1 Tax=Teredinibacter turnerae (strain ATCC 39867 / T7901) TaxID=377629 RepID=C5BSH4_TERTT|nr:hypothetical protein TERTU_1364 [Teredinibacter turnerae T7901]